MAFLCLSISVSAYDFEVDGIRYDITSFTELTVTASSLSSDFSGELSVPSAVKFNGKDLRVNKISPDFARSNTSITSLIVANTINEIGDYAFSGCESLLSIDITGVEQIGKYAFESCKRLTNVKLSDGLISISACAFMDNEALESIMIPSSVLSLGESVFKNCCSLRTVELPKDLTDIPNNAFANCTSLSQIDLPPVLTTIGNYAFSGTAFSEFIIPNSVKTIGQSILSSCFSLKKLTIGSGVTTLSSNPVPYCDSLEELILADSENDLIITYRGDVHESYRWHKYSPIQTTNDWVSVEFRKGGLTLIPFKKLYIGRNLLSSDELYSSSGGYNSNNYTLPPLSYHPTVETISISSNVTNMPSSEFNLNLDGYIGFRYNNTFGYLEGCSSLSEIVGSPQIKTIGKYFIKGTMLSDFCISYSVETVLDYAFCDCEQLTTVTFGKMCKYIGTNIFSNSASLSTINFYCLKAPECKTQFTNNQYINVALRIPPGTTESYNSQDPWCNFWNVEESNDLISEFIIYPFKYEIIEDSAVEVSDFVDNSLTECTISSEVEYNGKCYSVCKLGFGGSVLPNCETVVLPNTIEVLPSRIFNAWPCLRDVKLGECLHIGSEAFRNCISLIEIIIPSSCLSVGNDAFTGCSSLKSVEFNYSSSKIELGCNTTINLSSSITPFPNPSDVDERRTGFRNGYYDGLFYGLPIEHLVINRDIELPKYYKRTIGNSTSSYSTVYNDIVYYPPFYGLKNLKYVEIGENVSAICKNQIDAVVNAKATTMEYTNFGKCDNIEVVVSNNPNAPIGGGFSQTVYENASLFLPNGGVESYKNDDYWKNFTHINETSFIPIESISFESDEVTIDVNDCKTLNPIINPSEASIKTLKWSSSNASIVNVSEDGVITSSSREGESTITVTACDGSGISASIKVITQKSSNLNDFSFDKTINISTKDGKIFISGKNDIDIVKVYNIQGVLLKSSKDSILDMNTKGIHIVKVGSVVKKITL